MVENYGNIVGPWFPLSASRLPRGVPHCSPARPQSRLLNPSSFKSRSLLCRRGRERTLGCGCRRKPTGGCPQAEAWPAAWLQEQAQALPAHPQPRSLRHPPEQAPVRERRGCRCKGRRRRPIRRIGGRRRRRTRAKRPGRPGAGQRGCQERRRVCRGRGRCRSRCVRFWRACRGGEAAAGAPAQARPAGDGPAGRRRDAAAQQLGRQQRQQQQRRGGATAETHGPEARQQAFSRAAGEHVLPALMHESLRPPRTKGYAGTNSVPYIAIS